MRDENLWAAKESQIFRRVAAIDGYVFRAADVPVRSLGRNCSIDGRES